MATWDELSSVALALPEVEERTTDAREWRFRNKLVAWERPLRRSDREAMGDQAPEGPIVAVWLPDLAAKEALLEVGGEAYFTIPHFDGYRAILIRLELIPIEELEELVIEAWIDRAPKRLVREWESAGS
jgi:hypothetical protein